MIMGKGGGRGVDTNRVDTMMVGWWFRVGEAHLGYFEKIVLKGQYFQKFYSVPEVREIGNFRVYQ